MNPRFPLLALALVVAAPAWADLIRPAEAECREKQQGAACRAGDGAGVCEASTCSRKDYSGGVPPKTKSVPCLKCVAKGAADAGPAHR